ncbi:MAG TPA: dihydrolipoamide acetyltransferase family protein [Kofleriaceae bacterium]|nr:dihydrolipoamide acetyltransferase family protein [Kofleriaceae bacterium]
MAQILGLPKLSPTMEEGVLVRWTKKEGDKVSPGDLVAEVETDKANMDFNIEDEGVLLKFLVKEGDTVKLGAPVAIIGKAGEDVSALVEQAKAGGGGGEAKPAEKKAEAKKEDAPAKKAEPAKKADAAPAKPAPAKAAPARQGAEDSANAPAAKKAPREATRPEQDQTGKAAVKPATSSSSNGAPSGGRLLASPLAKSLAIELGIDLRQVTGTGPGGRIVERDVRNAADGGGGGNDGHGAEAPEADHADHTDRADQAEADAQDAAPAKDERGSQALAVRAPAKARVTQTADSDGDWEDVPASNMRKRIAARLTEAKRDVPHFYLMRDLDASALLAYRGRLNELLGDKGKVSVNDLVIKAVALALRRMPECNASWEGEAIRHFHRVHIGVAVAIPDGLVTPVVRDADQKGIGSIAAEVKDLAERAKKRALKAHEITGSTFSVSNLGMFGIERFTAILNPPEAGILAVGAVRDVPVVNATGQVVAGKRMTVTMSCDHRVIDGALGARWLQVLGELVEKPESLAL